MATQTHDTDTTYSYFPDTLGSASPNTLNSVQCTEYIADKSSDSFSLQLHLTMMQHSVYLILVQAVP